MILFFTLVFTPSIFFNTLFHSGATAISGVYCPGLLTALTLYLPLYFLVSRLAFQEGLLTNGVGLATFLVAGAFHFAEVGHNVFKAW